MKRIIKIGDWIFEVVQVRARRAKEYGADYNGIAVITITNNKPNIEGMLCKK